MKSVTVVGTPRIDVRPALPYFGLRVQTPFAGMFGVVGKLDRALHTWMKQHPDALAGARFLRYHVIDMAGEMDIELAVPVRGALATGQLPAGRYASLIYTGSGLVGNRALLDWGAANALQWDKQATPQGDAFAARYETYLTDRAVEPRKLKWQIEVAIKLNDASGSS